MRAAGFAVISAALLQAESEVVRAHDNFDMYVLRKSKSTFYLWNLQRITL